MVLKKSYADLKVKHHLVTYTANLVILFIKNILQTLDT